MSAEKFLEKIEGLGFVDENIINKIRKQVADPSKNVTAKAIAKYLVSKNQLTVAQAKKMLPAEAPPPPAAPQVPASAETVMDEIVVEQPKAAHDSDLLVDIEPEISAPVTPTAAPDSRKNPPIDATTIDTQQAAGPEHEDIIEVQPGDVHEIDANQVEILHADAAEQIASKAAHPPPAGFESFDDPFHDPSLQPQAETDYSPSFSGKRAGRAAWSSKWLFIGPAIIGLLTIVGVILYIFFSKAKPEEVWQAANDSYVKGDYGTAIETFDQFIDKFSGHENHDLAKVFKVRALLAQSFTSKQWDETYNRANNKLPEIEELTEFSEIREDLSDILPKVARGFTEQALREQDAEKKAEILKKVDAAIALYSRPSYIPSSLRERPAVDKVIREVADKRREIDHQLTMEKDYRVALAEIRNMNAAGKTNDAIDQYQKLTSKYRELAARPELQQAIADASLAEQQNVKPVSLDWAAVNQEAPSPIDKTLVLATQTGSPAVGIENETVAYLVDGSVYQIKAGDGSILWRRYVGFQTRHDPVNIGNNLLVSDQNKKEIALVDGASGKLVWRLPIGGPYHQPRVQDQSILLTTAAGKLLRINAADGTISAACQLPQQTTVPCASNSSFVYQPGRHTNLYVMAADDMSCTSVNFVGADHVAGSISVPPTIVSGHLLLLVNGGDYSNLHVYRIEDDGKKLTEVQIFPRITKGVVNTPMFRFDRWVLLVSDIGDMKMLAINSTEADDPVSISVDEQFAVDEQMQNQMEMFGLKHYLSAKSGRLWIGNRGLSQYRIVKSQAKFDRKTWTNGSDVYLGPIVRKGDFILTLRRRNKSALASVSAIDPETHQQIWRTDFSAPLAGSVVKEDKSTFAVSSQGDIFPINESLLTSGYSGKPSSRGSEIIETLVFEDNVPLGPGKRVFYGPLARTKILNADIDAGQARVVDLLAPANKPSCPPIAFADQIIIASKSGQVAKVNPATGKTTLTPFQPEVQPGKPIRWCQPAIIDGTRFVIANGDSGMVYLLEATDVDIQSRFELDHQIKIMSPLVNVGEAVLAVDFDESRYRLLNFSVSDSIKLISSHELPADYVAGPMKFDSGVLLQLANNQLVFFAADKFAAGTSNSKPSWTVELRNQKLAGPPIDFGGNILLATQAGQLLVVNPATGEKIKSVELGQPIAGSPTLSGSQLLIGGRDGSVHVVSTDQLK